MSSSSSLPTLRTVAIASRHPGGPDGLVADSLTDSPLLVIATLAGSKLVALTTLSKPALWAPSQDLPPEFVTYFAVDTVAAGAVDKAMDLLLAARGIRVITGAHGSVQDAIELALRSSAPATDKQPRRSHETARARAVRVHAPDHTDALSR